MAINFNERCVAHDIKTTFFFISTLENYNQKGRNSPYFSFGSWIFNACLWDIL